MSEKYPRFVIEKVQEALVDTPIVFIAGPRQCGKTTLVKSIINEEWEYITFDNAAQLEIAKEDPIGFIHNLSTQKTVLDEVHKVPELFACIKESVDENRIPGRFLLTGSANAMLLPQLSDSLAGRIETISLFPLSECEIRKNKTSFLDKLILEKPFKANEIRIRNLLFEKIANGGFPEPLARTTEKRKIAWYRQFINSLIQKDLKEISEIEHIEVVPLLLRLLSNYAAQIANVSDISSQCGLSNQTIDRYFSLLTQLYLVHKLPAWHRNHNKRLIKSPKIHFIDTGLICALRSITKEKLEKELHVYGRLLECYVYCELKRQASWNDEEFSFYHYRDKDKAEVDLVLEIPDGRVFGIEIKASATLTKSDFHGLKKLQETVGEDFSMGVLLYDGDTTTAFGEKLFAVPIGALWS